MQSPAQNGIIMRLLNLPGEESTYDPETGVFTVNYGYIGGGGLMREIRETWTPSNNNLNIIL